MFDAIKQVYASARNDGALSGSTKSALGYGAASWAAGSLGRRFWISANQLMEDPRAREKVFRAGQRVFAWVAENQDANVNTFAMLNRMGAVALGVVSVACALRAVNIIWIRYHRSER